MNTWLKPDGEFVFSKFSNFWYHKEKNLLKLEKFCNKQNVLEFKCTYKSLFVDSVIEYVRPAREDR